MEINYEELDLKAKLGAFSTFDAEVLVPEVMKLESGDIYLEIGVDQGKSLSIAKMVAKPGVEIVGIDLKENPNVDGTTFFRGNSIKWSRKWHMGDISVLFIDGDHSYLGCKNDIEGWYPWMKEGGVMLFHDCDESSPGVQWAVAEFVSTHPHGEYQIFKRSDKNTSMARIKL